MAALPFLSVQRQMIFPASVKVAPWLIHRTRVRSNR